MNSQRDKSRVLTAIITTLILLVIVIVMFRSGQKPILLTLVTIVLAGYTLKSLWKLKTPGT